MNASAVRVDAHQHFWQLARGDYRWLTPELTVLYRDFGPADLEPLLARHALDGTILVQAAPTVAETEFLLALAERTPFVLGVVGWLDFDAADATEVLARLARHPKLVGVRPMIQDLADDRWMLAPGLAPIFRALVEHGLAFDALVKPRHLAHLVRLVERHPDLRVVIDHGAKPAIADGGRAWPGFERWSRELAELARSPRVAAKLSGLVTEARADWTAPDLAPFVDVLCANFLPDRLLWGSDWPVVELAGGYTRWWDATHALLAERVRDERARTGLFGRNALDFYRISNPRPAASGRTA
ncbi:MAG: amidohydrolase family protein [Planctomycetes bacterium]|nr:amidohydrolase family protein [Planctomycetota bacterium]